MSQKVIRTDVGVAMGLSFFVLVMWMIMILIESWILKVNTWSIGVIKFNFFLLLILLIFGGYALKKAQE